MESTPAIEQAECENCYDDTQFRVINREYDMSAEEDEDVHITRTVRCRNCDSEGTVAVGFDGTESGGVVTFENAAWNQEDEDESE